MRLCQLTSIPALLFLLSADVRADPVGTAEVTLDWSSFRMSFTGGITGVFFLTQTSVSGTQISAWPDLGVALFGSTSVPGWADTSHMGAVPPLGSTDARTTDTELFASATATDIGPLPSGFGFTEAIGTTTRVANFISMGTGAGTIEMSIPYSITVALTTDTSPFSQWAEADGTGAGVSLFGPGDLWTSDYFEYSGAAFDGDDLFDTVSGVLSISLPFAPSTFGFLSVDGVARTFVHNSSPVTSAPVPEPCLLWLLAVALPVLRRRLR